MKFNTPLFSLALCASAIIGSLTTGAYGAVVNSFSAMPPGAVFHNLPATGSNDPFEPVMIVAGTTTVTMTATDRGSNGTEPLNSPALLGTFDFSSASFNSFNVAIDPTVAPGDRKGEFESGADVFLNFDHALSAAGVSLFSSIFGGTFPTSGSAGVIVTAYTGVDGTGFVLGSITSPDNPLYTVPRPIPVGSARNQHIYFVGIVSDSPAIRSLRLQPTNYSRGLHLDGVAVAVPEPAASVGLLGIGGLAMLLQHRRK